MEKNLWNNTTTVVTVLSVWMVVWSHCLAHQDSAIQRSKRFVVSDEDLLYLASGDGDLEKVKELVASGTDVNSLDGICIYKASKNGHTEVVKYLLSVGAYVNGTANGEEQQLHTGKALASAAENNHLEIIRILLDAGAAIKPRRFSVGALEAAAKNGHIEALQLLLEYGKPTQESLDDAIIEASAEGYTDIVEMLLDAGADVSAWNGLGSQLMRAATDGHLEVVKLLLERGVTTEHYADAFSIAASRGHLDVVKILLEYGADVNTAGALSSASEYGQPEMVKFLLESGASLVCDGDDNKTCPWHLAAKNGHVDIVALFVQYGIDINQPVNETISLTSYFGEIFTSDAGNAGQGWTVMHFAASRGHPIMGRLVDLGANINVQDAHGRTPLHIAVLCGKLIVAQEILKYCADLTLVDKEGNSASDIAKIQATNNVTQATYQRLVKAVREIMPQISTMPDNFRTRTTLAADFIDIVNANETLKKDLGNLVHYPIYARGAVNQLLEERFITGITQIFDDYRCKPALQDFDTIAMGTKFVATCECVPGQKPMMIFVPIEEANLCSTEPPIQIVTESPELLPVAHSSDIPIPADTVDQNEDLA